MKRSFQLPEKYIIALRLVKAQVEKQYQVKQMIVYGSQVRQEGDEESDYDVLLLTERPLSHMEKHEVYAIVTAVNQHCDTEISVLVVDATRWEEGTFSVLPIKEEITREGIVVG